MAHLVPEQEGVVGNVINVLCERHSELVDRAVQVSMAMQDLPRHTFGSAAKRLRAGEQPLIEVLNQCATLERMLDALDWCVQSFGASVRVRCHPTTSSNKSDPEDSDIVVTDSHRTVARMEVSDVISEKSDGNQKEKKDLLSLQVNENWKPDGVRRFLVVSPEFGALLQRRHAKRSGSTWSYRRVGPESTTRNTTILEIVPRPQEVAPA